MFTFNGFLAKLKTKFSTNKTPTSSHRFPLVLSDGTPDGNATAADVQAFLGELLGVNSYSVAKNETTSIAVARCPQIIFINNTNQSGGGIRVDYNGVEIATTGSLGGITVTLRNVSTNEKYVDVANASAVNYTALSYGRTKGF